MQDCTEMDMLILGEGRMAAKVCSLLEYDGFQAKMPGLLREVISYGEESLFNAGLVEHASSSVYTNGSFSISFTPDRGVGEATARPKRLRSAAEARGPSSSSTPVVRPPAGPPAGLRMEVACCDADHEGEWEGEWEECEVLADHGDTCDVRIVGDDAVCSSF